MCPLILNKKHRRTQIPPESFNSDWVKEVVRRCQLAQNCLSPEESAAPQAWEALGVLIKEDVPQILDKVNGYFGAHGSTSSGD